MHKMMLGVLSIALAGSLATSTLSATPAAANSAVDQDADPEPDMNTGERFIQFMTVPMTPDCQAAADANDPARVEISCFAPLREKHEAELHASLPRTAESSALQEGLVWPPGYDVSDLENQLGMRASVGGQLFSDLARRASSAGYARANELASTQSSSEQESAEGVLLPCFALATPATQALGFGVRAGVTAFNIECLDNDAIQTDPLLCSGAQAGIPQVPLIAPAFVAPGGRDSCQTLTTLYIYRRPVIFGAIVYGLFNVGFEVPRLAVGVAGPFFYDDL